MKRNKSGFTSMVLLIIVVILVVILLSLVVYDKAKVTSKITIVKVGIKTPIWDKNDFSRSDSQAQTYGVSSDFDMPFYKGKLPLAYIMVVPASDEIGGGISKTPYCFDFKEFQNDFVYKDGILAGAIAKNRDGYLVAEARIRRYETNDGSEDIWAEEFHYNKNQKLIFYCKSKLDVNFGTKLSEKEISGKKDRDYFFIWPRGL